jgi:hypothetical protein
MDNGVMNALLDRLTGPLHFRMIFQPLMGSIFGIRDGWRDAKEGRPAYFWAVFTDGVNRKAFLRDGLRSVEKILILAAVLDLVYQYIELGKVRLGPTFVIAILLAFVPYLLVRGPVNRIVRRWLGAKSTEAK